MRDTWVNRSKQQLLKAKAISAENRELKGLTKYGRSRLKMAVRVPNPLTIPNWDEVVAWLNHESDETLTLDNEHPLDKLDPYRLVGKVAS